MTILLVLLLLGGFLIFAAQSSAKAKAAEADQRQAEMQAYIEKGQAALDEVNALPELPTIEPGFALQRGEVCHWAGPCAWFELRSRTTRISYHGPTLTIPIMKGIKYRAGSFAPSTERTHELVQVDTGILFITSKRLVFDGHSKNSVVTLKSMIRVGVFPGGFEAEKQTGKSPYLKFDGDPHTPAAIASRALTAFVEGLR